MSNQTNSYGNILKSSSIIGGAQGINYLIGMVRTKVVAVLLGPSGVGLVGLYISITGLVSTLAQLGIDQSGVREVAEANGSGDPEQVARTVKTLRRACWFTGIVGWLLTVGLAWPLSQWTFGTPERMGAVGILGVTVLLGTLNGGQAALLQGMRRIGDLARVQVFSALLTTVVAIALYAWLGQDGVVPVIIATAAVQLGFSWNYSRRIQITHITQSWGETARHSKRLIGLGLAFMYGMLLNAIVGVAIRSSIVRHLGLDANGIYQAAWALSGMFAGFILAAMGTDFYPRLTAVAHDNEQVNRLVNEQTEIGLLLALPGVVATLCFAPLVIHFFYSARFLMGAELLPWFAAGVFVQVIIFPLGYIQRAKAATKWIYIGQSSANLSHMILALLAIPLLGLRGSSYAFLTGVSCHAILVYFIARHLSGFHWSSESQRLVFWSSAIVLMCIAINQVAWQIPRMVAATMLLCGCVTFSLRGIAALLDADHRIIRHLVRLPGSRLILK